MKLQITEHDITKMVNMAVKKIISEVSWYDYDRDEDFTPGPDEKETLDMDNLVASCMLNYYEMPEHQDEGMEFMKSFYPEGVSCVEEYGYETMIEEACGNVKLNLPYPEITADGYSYHHPSGDYDIPDDDGINFEINDSDVEDNIEALQQFHLPEEILSAIQGEIDGFVEDPLNYSFEWRY